MTTYYHKDDYGTLYTVSYTDTNGVLDITTKTEQPSVWGDDGESEIRNKVMYKRGVVTICRQLLRRLDTGYEIIATGESQEIDWIATGVPCRAKYSHQFANYLNNAVQDQAECLITIGPAWGYVVDDMVWADWDDVGNTASLLMWANVWGPD